MPLPKLSNSRKIIVVDGVHCVFFFIRFLSRASSWGISRFQGRLRGSTGSPVSVNGGGGKGLGWNPTPGLRPRRLIERSPSGKSSQASSLRPVGLLTARLMPYVAPLLRLPVKLPKGALGVNRSATRSVMRGWASGSGAGAGLGVGSRSGRGICCSLVSADESLLKCRSI